MARERAGTALGVMDTFFALSGFLAPAVTGWLLGATGSFASAFWLLAILSLSAVIAVLIFHRPDAAGLRARAASAEASSSHIGQTTSGAPRRTAR